jgi:tetratricopeptide (TPR) repeat protein
MLALGFIAMSMALRKMRAGQYETLEREVTVGQKALEAKQFEQSLAHFDRAVTIAHSLYSDKLFKTTRSGARALPPDYYLPWIGKATALALSGKGTKALTILEIILEVDPTNADLWLNKGEVLMAVGRPAEAYIAFEQAQRIAPSLAAAGTSKAKALTLIQRRMG